MIKYKLNLVKTVRVAEKRARQQKSNMLLVALVCFGALGLAAFNTHLKIQGMQRSIAAENRRLRAVEAEYKKYQEMHVSIDKTDIELLNQLQMNRIYWTKKLEAMASHLPYEQPISYWITRFGFRGNNFNVRGYGYITHNQEQLLALDNYLNDLRNDPSFSSVFTTTSLNSAVRSDEDNRERISFDYTATRRPVARARGGR